MSTPSGEPPVGREDGHEMATGGGGNPPPRRPVRLDFDAMEKTFGPRTSYALTLARLAADVANYCDHAEHNEEVSRSWILSTAAELRQLAMGVARAENIDLLATYGERLLAIETKNVLNSAESFDGRVAVQQAHTWRDLQLVQIQHDRFFHPDVLGLHKLDQLRHYSLHLSKLAGAFARWAMNEVDEAEIISRRLPDALLFGIKLSTVMGEKLPMELLSGEFASADPDATRPSIHASHSL